MEKSTKQTGSDNQRDHFVNIDKIFREKGGRLYPFIPKVLIRYIEHITHQNEINQSLDRLYDHMGLEFIEELIENEFGVDVHVVNPENIPVKGRYIIASNHPLGGLDGLALMYAIGKKRKDIKFIVNDILLELRNLKELFVPINKYGQKSYESVRQIEDLYQSDQLVLIFPAGMVSRRQKGRICDLEWKKSFITKAIRHKRDVIPVYIKGRNSNFFYNLASLRKKIGIKLNLEMLYLPDEMLKQREKTIVITFGKPIPYTMFTNNKRHHEWAQKVKQHVYRLPEGEPEFKK